MAINASNEHTIALDDPDAADQIVLALRGGGGDYTYSEYPTQPNRYRSNLEFEYEGQVFTTKLIKEEGGKYKVLTPRAQGAPPTSSQTPSSRTKTKTRRYKRTLPGGGFVIIEK